MNLFNRFVSVLVLLGVIACSALVAVGVYLPDSLRTSAAEAIGALFAAPGVLQFPQRVLVSVIAGVILLVAFILLVLELRPGESSDTVRVNTADGEQTSVVRKAIHDRVQFSVDRLDDVIQVDPVIQGGSKGLTVHLDVTTSPYIDVPMKTEEIRAVTRDVIEKQMGLMLRKLTVTIDHKRYEEFAHDEVGGL